MASISNNNHFGSPIGQSFYWAGPYDHVPHFVQPPAHRVSPTTGANWPRGPHGHGPAGHYFGPHPESTRQYHFGESPFCWTSDVNIVGANRGPLLVDGRVYRRFRSHQPQPVEHHHVLPQQHHQQQHHQQQHHGQQFHKQQRQPLHQQQFYEQQQWTQPQQQQQQHMVLGSVVPRAYRTRIAIGDHQPWSFEETRDLWRSRAEPHREDEQNGFGNLGPHDVHRVGTTGPDPIDAITKRAGASTPPCPSDEDVLTTPSAPPPDWFSSGPIDHGTGFGPAVRTPPTSLFIPDVPGHGYQAAAPTHVGNQWQDPGLLPLLDHSSHQHHHNHEYYDTVLPGHHHSGSNSGDSTEREVHAPRFVSPAGTYVDLAEDTQEWYYESASLNLAGTASNPPETASEAAWLVSTAPRPSNDGPLSTHSSRTPSLSENSEAPSTAADTVPVHSERNASNSSWELVAGADSIHGPVYRHVSRGRSSSMPDVMDASKDQASPTHDSFASGNVRVLKSFGISDELSLATTQHDQPESFRWSDEEFSDDEEKRSPPARRAAPPGEDPHDEQNQTIIETGPYRANAGGSLRMFRKRAAVRPHVKSIFPTILEETGPEGASEAVSMLRDDGLFLGHVKQAPIAAMDGPASAAALPVPSVDSELGMDVSSNISHEASLRIAPVVTVVYQIDEQAFDEHAFDEHAFGDQGQHAQKGVPSDQNQPTEVDVSNHAPQTDQPVPAEPKQEDDLQSQPPVPNYENIASAEPSHGTSQGHPFVDSSHEDFYTQPPAVPSTPYRDNARSRRRGAARKGNRKKKAAGDTNASVGTTDEATVKSPEIKSPEIKSPETQSLATKSSDKGPGTNGQTTKRSTSRESCATTTKENTSPTTGKSTTMIKVAHSVPAAQDDTQTKKRKKNRNYWHRNGKRDGKKTGRAEGEWFKREGLEESWGTRRLGERGDLGNEKT